MEQEPTPSNSPRIDFPDETAPTPEEAIALTIAIARFHEEQASEARTTDEWNPDRWALLGRLAALGTPVDRLPQSLPRNPWSTHSRADLY